jgi:hypothetical protein
MGYRGGPLVSSSLSRSLGELEHVSAPRPVCSDGPLGRIEPPIRIDQALEAPAETGMRRSDHDLGLIPRPCSQTADPAPSRYIAHRTQRYERRRLAGSA